jgi:hypothetical protein
MLKLALPFVICSALVGCVTRVGSDKVSYLYWSDISESYELDERTIEKKVIVVDVEGAPVDTRNTLLKPASVICKSLRNGLEKKFCIVVYDTIASQNFSVGDVLILQISADGKLLGARGQPTHFDIDSSP